MTGSSHLDDALLMDMLLDRLDGGERHAVQAHLAGCLACRTRQQGLAPLAAGLERIAAAGRRAPPPRSEPRWRTAVMRAPMSASQPTTFSRSSVMHRTHVLSRRLAMPFAAMVLAAVSFVAGRSWESRAMHATVSASREHGAVLGVQRASSELTIALDSLTRSLDSLPPADAARARDVALAALLATIGAQSRIDPVTLRRVVHATDTALGGFSFRSRDRLPGYVSF